jgi:YidC/Oxa1 family membrane protein insertase
MDRNTLFAFFLIAIVLIFTPKYMEMVAPSPQAPPLPDVENAKDTSRQAPAERGSAKQGIEPSVYSVNETPGVLWSNEEKTITVECELYTAVVSSNGGGSFLSFSFKHYFDKDGLGVNLINGRNKENLSIKFKDLDGENVDLFGPWQYADTFSGGEIYRPQSLEFSMDVFPGKRIVKTLTFYPDSYLIDVTISAGNVADGIFGGVYSLGWYGGLVPSEENEKDDLFYFNSFVYQGGELVDLKVKEGESETTTFNGATDWVAVRTKYFITSIVPDNPGDVVSAFMSGTNDGRDVYDIALTFPATEPTTLSLYLGPLEYEKIKSINRELERVMNFGWGVIRPISKGVLFVLKKLHEFIPNYGYVLILFSFAVKLLVYPLTKKSYQSTAAMQQLQPEIAALKEKHGNNPQKLNQATMKLYKEKGVNPLGGCLPMLLQMPLLFALFQVFRTTIELRAEPFIWWIKDLSAPDAVYTLPFSIPIYGSHVAILPILMVVSMFIQQRMMSGGAAQQPQQKTMQYFMTGFFFLMFNSFPSGLNLYYTLFNVLTIAQQKLIPPAENTTT